MDWSQFSFLSLINLIEMHSNIIFLFSFYFKERGVRKIFVFPHKMVIVLSIFFYDKGYFFCFLFLYFGTIYVNKKISREMRRTTSLFTAVCSTLLFLQVPIVLLLLVLFSSDAFRVQILNRNYLNMNTV